MVRLGAKVVALLAFFLADFLLYGALVFLVTDGFHLSPLLLVYPWKATEPLSFALSGAIAIATYRSAMRHARRGLAVR